MQNQTVLLFILAGIVLINGLYAVRLFFDLKKHKKEVASEPGNPFVMGISSFVLYFLSSFGIPDFALSTALYRHMKWVDDKNLPGTLNTQCVIPISVMAFSYINAIEVDVLTPVVCIGTQTAGAFILPRFVVKIPIRTLKLIIGVSLFLATGFILLGKFNLFPIGGTATALKGGELWFVGGMFVLFGAMNAIGIGSYPFTMITILAFGMNPAIIYPLMMGACTFSIPASSIEFIKTGRYSRKITLISSTFGIFGVLLAVFVVKNINVRLLEWIVILVLTYSGFTLLYEEYGSKSEKHYCH